MCDTCKGYKQEMRASRLSPGARQAVLDRYGRHLASVWQDRLVYRNAQELSLSFARMVLQEGCRAERLGLNASFMALIADGIDQAKFRLPRQNVKGHAFERLIRPALHVQGVWAHGLAYHLSVADADMPKDTNNNVESIARMLEHCLRRSGGLPLGLHIQQDNTCRECKNQKILKFAIALVALNVFRWISLNYLIKGHTHEGIDATFGQITTKMACEEFDDPTQVVRLLQRIVAVVGVDGGARENSLAYKLDESADWEACVHWPCFFVYYFSTHDPRGGCRVW